MTISGWVLFLFFACIIAFFAVCGIVIFESVSSKFLCGFSAVALIALILFGMLWYFNNTASGKRELIDQKSNFNNGIERTITVYTADGNVIAQYTGIIDIAENDGGYIKFDFDGKRYIYYNCFIESIANIE